VTTRGGVALAGLLTLVGCDAGGPPAACPAIGWSNTVTVELAGDWPAVDGGSVRLACSSPCGCYVRLDEDPAPVVQVPLPLGRSPSVEFGLLMTTPASAVVTVLGADGAVLAEVDTDLDWVRVGGSEECGGPHEATVEVPAPAHARAKPHPARLSAENRGCFSAENRGCFSAEKSGRWRVQSSTTRSPSRSCTRKAWTGAARLVQAPSLHR
jgi:hypothetical protein